MSCKQSVDCSCFHSLSRYGNFSDMNITSQFHGRSQSLFSVFNWLPGLAVLLYSFYLCTEWWASAPDYLIIEEVSRQPVNPQLCFCTQLSLHHDGVVQRPHHCRHHASPSVNLPLPHKTHTPRATLRFFGFCVFDIEIRTTVCKHICEERILCCNLQQMWQSNRQK